jgi:hypothetical protein
MMSGLTTDDSLLARFIAPNEQLNAGEIAMLRRLLLSYGIIEEAYELYKKRWIDDEQWEQWNTWLMALARHPLFAKLHTAATGMYDNDFQDHVSSLLGSGPTSPMA